MSLFCKKKQITEELMKQEIVNTVLSMINSDTSITMEEVAKRSGVAKGTLYNYFANKEELFHYVHETFLCPLRDEKSRIFSEDKDPMEVLCDFTDYTFRSYETVSRYFYFMQKYRTVEEDTKETRELVIKPLAATIRRGIEKGQIINVNPLILAETIWGTIIGTFRSIEHADAGRPDMESMKQDVIRLLKRLLIIDK
ncbi:TetR/AcrR family transcriptional regulator [Seleniivibrio woodruffii]|uniref:TetR family transcriptional regulator n=1 Tax=Seleniivibrio woodruffii TaxID=1078050 RepID=A0A4V2PSG6_9BACT|nr:TetR/AcrR family transcriptional regulator [Seleniivibrio woodruffii]TCK62551.1 TetR family transcriptional regulator [Seleniivibrio woodruffii]TVZ37022.1 TetR family transcriptional regulator [Seleniivibrio woodruffii]